MELIRGIGVSSGIVIGPAFVLDEVVQHVSRRRVLESDIPHQLIRLDEALNASINDLEKLRERVSTEFDKDAAAILNFHISLMSDTHFQEPIRKRIQDERVTAEYAVTAELQILADRFLAMDQEAFRSKVSDLWDLDRRLLKHLIGEVRNRLKQLETECIVVANDLTPGQTAGLDVAHVKAFATQAGGRTSHTSIMARSMGIPAVVGLDTSIEDIVDDDLIIVDGERGILIVNPDNDTLAEYETRREAHHAFITRLDDLVDQEAITTDGERIQLYANIEFAHEVDVANRMGADGIGLFRTEFIFMISDHDPTEDEQYEAYHEAIQLSNGKSTTIRTLDLGSDKFTQNRAVTPERNPALGCRSIRYCLQNLPVFRTQLRAILRASATGPVRIMFPLITGLMEFRQAKMVLSDVMEDLQDEEIAYDPDVEIGLMIETPSAAIMSHVFAREADFMSIGTNDLIQYTVAVDRTNERVANLYSSSHPAVIRLIKNVIRSGRFHKKEVSVCGEVASDVNHVMLLIGLGLRSFSMVPPAIPDIKRIIRMIDTDHCEQIARKAGSFDSERQVLNYLRDSTQKILAGGSADGPANGNHSTN